MRRINAFVDQLVHEQSFRLMSDASIVSITDLKGTILYANDNFSKISGYAVEELLGKNHNIVNSGYHSKQLWATMWKTILNGKIWREEVRNKKKDGSFYWVDTQIMPCRDDDGKIIVLLSIRNDITEKKCIELEKNELNNRLRLVVEKFESTNAQLTALIESLPDAIFFKDSDSRWLLTNEAAKKLFKLHGFDWAGKTEQQLADERPLFKAAHQKCFADDEKAWNEKKLTFFTEFLQDDNGNVREYEVRKIPLFHADGSRKGLVIVGTDITERRQAEQTLLESEQRFRAVADSAPVLLWMSGTDKLCYFFNKGWLDFTGRTLEQEAGNGWAEGVHPDDLDRCIKIYATHFDLRESFTMEYRLRRHDGQYRWIVDNGIPRYLPNGEFVGYIGSCFDVSERKEAEAHRLRITEELEISKQKFESLFAQNHEAVFSVDLSGNYTSANKRFLDELECRLEDVLQKHYSMFTHPDSLSVVNDHFEKAKQGISTRYECKTITTTHKILHVYLVNIPIVVNHTIVGIYIVATDITYRVQAETKLIRQNRQLSEIAWIQSHEVRGPVATILGLLNLFNQKNMGDPFNAVIHDKLVESTQKLDEVIHKIVGKTNEVDDFHYPPVQREVTYEILDLEQ